MHDRDGWRERERERESSKSKLSAQVNDADKISLFGSLIDLVCSLQAAY